MNEKDEQKQENEPDTIVDLEVADEQADQARAGSGPFQSDYKYVPVR
jgi:hypothetical protein